MSAKYCFGIDVGGTTIKCGLFNVEGEILEKWEILTRTEDNGAYILPDVADAVLDKMRDEKIKKTDVAGIGIGIPGPVDEEGCVEVAVNLHWGRVNITKVLHELTGLPVRAANDANVAARGELWKGGGAGYHNMIMVTLGTGVGGGIIINDRILAGSNGAAGEIGHAHVEDAIKEPCNCGNCGCLEQVASATGIVRLAREELSASDQPSMLREGELSAKAVFDAVKAGDELACRIAERFGAYLGKALAVFSCVTAPEVFVIGGGVSKAGPVILDYIQKYYREYAFSACKQAAFALATLGNDAGICGAARMVLQ